MKLRALVLVFVVTFYTIAAKPNNEQISKRQVCLKSAGAIDEFNLDAPGINFRVLFDCIRDEMGGGPVEHEENIFDHVSLF